MLKEDTHQQAKKKSDQTAAGGNNVDLDITAPTLMEKTATDLLLLYDGAFRDLFVFSRSMGYGDLRSVFRGEG